MYISGGRTGMASGARIAAVAASSPGQANLNSEGRGGLRRSSQITELAANKIGKAGKR